ncbi:MAG: lipid-A-disaccharide synthase [Rikenellaceae bacterium]|nr:lipid-A-disaccharide synthase [Rikenellaceae bacterium]
MKYYIIAGEASGDLHGSNLMKSLLEEDPGSDIRFWGGDLMSSVGGILVKHYKDTAVMGIVEVISKLGQIAKNLDFCKKDILEYRPDVVILIDYPGFNFKIAKFARKHSIKVFYYIPPTVWAWKEWRVKSLKKYVDRLFIIFPFEVDFYKKKGMKAFYFGNPLLESIANHECMNESGESFRKRCQLDERPIIALLAGSRSNEVKTLMPIFIQLQDRFPEYQLVLAGVNSIGRDIYNKYLSGTNIRILFGETYPILLHAKASALCSGTASLEAALIGTPQVVCYRANAITAAIVRILIKVKYVSLTNLIFNQPVVKELLQNDCNVENISRELERILSDKEQAKIRKRYEKLRKVLGEAHASKNIAKAMVNELQTIMDANRFFRYYSSPMGFFKLIADSESLIEIRYIHKEDELALNIKGAVKSNSILDETAHQLDEYFSEKRKEFDLPIKLSGTAFQKRVWKELSMIPYGKVKTYGEIATLVETKDASRAVGNACRMNPLPIVIPCHRVVGANNKLTGFNMGIDKKSYLLGLEKVFDNSDTNLFNANINQDK